MRNSGIIAFGVALMTMFALPALAWDDEEHEEDVCPVPIVEWEERLDVELEDQYCDDAWDEDEGGNDTIVGTAYADFIWGDSGNDTLRGYGGNDELGGGADPDTIYGGDGDYWIEGGTGDDWLYGENGCDYLFGQSGTGDYCLCGTDDRGYGDASCETTANCYGCS